MFAPSQYLAADELLGRDVTLTISAVSIGELPIEGSSKTEKRPIVTFKERPKQLVLNKTNSKTIARLYGVITKDWLGRAVTLYQDKTKLKGQTVDCIRIRSSVPPAKVTPPTMLDQDGEQVPPDPRDQP
ncbi:MAG: hypothetical protein M3Q61_01325 [Chloroflexota bacterium]|nr:hypothetical protein [Chloroflexota bacterium]